VAAGYPVLIERGLVTTKEGWMGHYGIITGYDDAKQQVRIPDSYLGDITMSYDEISRYWDQFDDIYLVVYPYDKTEEVVNILGPQWDQEYNLRFASSKPQHASINWKAWTSSLLGTVEARFW